MNFISFPHHLTFSSTTLNFNFKSLSSEYSSYCPLDPWEWEMKYLKILHFLWTWKLIGSNEVNFFEVKHRIICWYTCTIWDLNSSGCFLSYVKLASRRLWTNNHFASQFSSFTHVHRQIIRHIFGNFSIFSFLLYNYHTR